MIEGQGRMPEGTTQVFAHPDPPHDRLGAGIGGDCTGADLSETESERIVERGLGRLGGDTLAKMGTGEAVRKLRGGREGEARIQLDPGEADELTRVPLLNGPNTEAVLHE